jgi:sarcosine oxidase subunit beta
MHAVVIGAGVIGSSIALQLKRLGHDVTVIDRNSAAGMGSTSASSAVVRFNYSTLTPLHSPGSPTFSGRSSKS